MTQSVDWHQLPLGPVNNSDQMWGFPNPGCLAAGTLVPAAARMLNIKLMADSPSKGSKVGKIISTTLLVIGIILALLIFVGRKQMMGQQYQVTDIEFVNYSKNATEEDAKKLGEILTSQGFFNGKKAKNVLLMKDENGVVVSFILDNRWDDPKVVSALRDMGAAVAQEGFGNPLTIKLLDGKLNTRNEIVVE